MSDPRRETVLVVEYEPVIRDLLRLHLSLAGFDMHEVGMARKYALP